MKILSVDMLYLQALSAFCSEPDCRDVYTKIQHHVDVLEQSTARVSSRAEVYGAVQQVNGTISAEVYGAAQQVK